jgi:hypothetical protein
LDRRRTAAAVWRSSKRSPKNPARAAAPAGAVSQISSVDDLAHHVQRDLPLLHLHFVFDPIGAREVDAESGVGRIPTTGSFDGEIPVPHLKVTVSDHQNNPFGIQWQRYWDGSEVPDLVKTAPHVAFEVDDLTAPIRDQKVIIKPNSPSNGVMVAFIEVNGAPVELMQIDHSLRKDL